MVLSSAGFAAIISAVVDRQSLMVNDVDGQVDPDDKERFKPSPRAQLIYGLAGIASLLYGWHLLHR
jgi:hypothetical protein